MVFLFLKLALPKTNNQKPLKIGPVFPPKANDQVFQPSIFKCKLAVNFGEGINYNSYKSIGF